MNMMDLVHEIKVSPSLVRFFMHVYWKKEDNFVKRHYVIRDMTLWIASTIDKEKEKFLVLAGAGLTGAPSIGMWKEIIRMSLMQNAVKV